MNAMNGGGCVLNIYEKLFNNMEKCNVLLMKKDIENYTHNMIISLLKNRYCNHNIVLVSTEMLPTY